MSLHPCRGLRASLAAVGLAAAFGCAGSGGGPAYGQGGYDPYRVRRSPPPGYHDDAYRGDRVLYVDRGAERLEQHQQHEEKALQKEQTQERKQLVREQNQQQRALQQAGEWDKQDHRQQKQERGELKQQQREEKRELEEHQREEWREYRRGW